MILSYLILSRDYYGDMDINCANKLNNTLINIFTNSNIRIDFASFRYDNIQNLKVNECFNLLQFLYICISNGTMPIINISNVKIETLLMLYIHDFFVGVHFKEREMILLHYGICNDLKKVFTLIQANNLYIHKKSNITILFKDLYESFFYDKDTQNNTFFHDILKNLAYNKELLQAIYTPFNQALLIYKQKCLLDINSINISHRILAYKYPPCFFSSHNLIDFKKALDLGIDYVTISPIFYNKTNQALGIDFLANIPKELKQYAFALGGIDNNEKIDWLLEKNIAGFASIRYFLHNI